MSFLRRHIRLTVVGLSCAAAGAGAGAIATAGASTGSTAGASTASSTKPAAGPAKKLGPVRRFATRGVQGSEVVHTKRGFATVSFDRGSVKAVSGRQLTVAEGTPKATYRTVTVTIPSDAVVRDNRRKSTLSAVKPGQRVVVVTAPQRTYVIARTPRSSG